MTVTLRAMEPEDLDLLYKIENDEELWEVGTTNVPYSKYALHDYIAHASGDIYTDKQVRLMIENEEKTTVGILDLVNYEPRHQRAEVGVVIEKRHRGKGYALAAVLRLIDYARTVLHLHQLYALMPAGHQPSVSLFRQSGFRQTGILEDWLFDGKEYHNAVVMQFFL